jgi:hypothetical protein
MPMEPYTISLYKKSPSIPLAERELNFEHARITEQTQKSAAFIKHICYLGL